MDPDSWAASLGISREAIEIYRASDVIDLHVDSFIWTRVFGYDLSRRNGSGLFGARFYGQVDFPRLLEAGVTGATWVITTNPLRTSAGRESAFFRNVEHLLGVFRSESERFEVVRSAAEYRAARARGKSAAFIGVQGGNALDRDLDAWGRVPESVVTRVTLVHLSSSTLGETSSPLGSRERGLTPLGKDLVRRLDELRIFVDLAHVSRRGFFDAVEAHDASLPLIVTHTGVSGAHPHWRNLDDEQIRAIADSGGTVGVMYHGSYLGSWRRGRRAEVIADHLDHIVRVTNDSHVSLGSDWDGAIVTPRDMPTVTELPRLVQILLDRGWKPESVQKVLGANFLRTMAALRG